MAEAFGKLAPILLKRKEKGSMPAAFRLPNHGLRPGPGLTCSMAPPLLADLPHKLYVDHSQRLIEFDPGVTWAQIMARWCYHSSNGLAIQCRAIGDEETLRGYFEIFMGLPSYTDVTTGTISLTADAVDMMKQLAGRWALEVACEALEAVCSQPALFLTPTEATAMEVVEAGCSNPMQQTSQKCSPGAGP